MAGGFRAEYEAKKAAREAGGGAAPAAPATGVTQTPVTSAPAGAAEPPKKGFGKNRPVAAAPPPEPSSAPVDAPVNAATSATTESASSALDPAEAMSAASGDPPPEKPKRGRAAAPAPTHVENTHTVQTVQTIRDADPFGCGERYEFRARLTADELARVVAALKG